MHGELPLTCECCLFLSNVGGHTYTCVGYDSPTYVHMRYVLFECAVLLRGVLSVTVLPFCIPNVCTCVHAGTLIAVFHDTCPYHNAILACL